MWSSVVVRRLHRVVVLQLMRNQHATLGITGSVRAVLWDWTQRTKGGTAKVAAHRRSEEG